VGAQFQWLDHVSAPGQFDRVLSLSALHQSAPEAFAADQALAHASLEHGLKHMPEGIALTKAAVPVL
jgi:hypothetical protein